MNFMWWWELAQLASSGWSVGSIQLQKLFGSFSAGWPQAFVMKGVHHKLADMSD
jgi:hypothetical protein